MAPLPRQSHWRVVLILFALLGAGLYFFGRWAGRQDSPPVPAQVMMMSVMFGPLVGLLGFGLWWVPLGPGRWWVRLVAVLCVIVLAAGTVALAHPSIRMFVGMWGTPLAVAVAGLVAALPVGRWRPAVFGTVAVLAVVPWVALRLDGITGQFEFETSYRWTPTAEDQAAEYFANRPAPSPGLSVRAVGPVAPADWTGFRGARRDGVVSEPAFRGWDGSAPHERWRHPVGPAWSSFCAVGELLFTQEQRGDAEVVACYRADTGDELWASGEPGRHSDPPSGVGPRATPAFAEGKVFALTTGGMLVCLDAASGQGVWKVNLGEKLGASKPTFGLSTSPLVVGDLVIVNPASVSAPRLVAFAAATGEQRWAADGTGTEGYSSPHLATIHGSEHVLVFNGAGLFGHDPRSGRELWHYDWKAANNEPTAVQPLVLPDGRVVIGGGNVGLGTRCVAVRKQGAGWATAEAWKTTRFTPKFNDVVARDNHLYGLDNGGLTCLDLADGRQVWKDGQYGS
ncbi:MAG TPA: PQQ-binding-like beta-propeller repeat protein, partial [Gemmataceae bacterium]|nr:PQQ-binding-like beta-propeller repeat protein [Gemmataceae bacterium]